MDKIRAFDTEVHNKEETKHRKVLGQIENSNYIKFK